MTNFTIPCWVDGHEFMSLFFTWNTLFAHEWEHELCSDQIKSQKININKFHALTYDIFYSKGMVPAAQSHLQWRLITRTQQHVCAGSWLYGAGIHLGWPVLIAVSPSLAPTGFISLLFLSVLSPWPFLPHSPLGCFIPPPSISGVWKFFQISPSSLHPSWQKLSFDCLPWTFVSQPPLHSSLQHWEWNPSP